MQYALTIWQPWASLIISGEKRFEFRGWAFPLRLVGARIVIHAAKRKCSLDELQAVSRAPWRTAPGCNPANVSTRIDAHLNGTNPFPLGAGIGTVLLGTPRRAIDTLALTSGLHGEEIDEDIFAWPCLHPVAWPQPIPHRGAQRFFSWEPEDDLFSVDSAPPPPFYDAGLT